MSATTVGASSGCRVPLPAGAATIRRLSCETNVAPGAGAAWQLFVQVAGSDTGLMCTVSGAGTNCSENNITTPLTNGQFINMRANPIGLPVNTGANFGIKCGVVLNVPQTGTVLATTTSTPAAATPTAPAATITASLTPTPLATPTATRTVTITPTPHVCPTAGDGSGGLYGDDAGIGGQCLPTTTATITATKTVSPTPTVTVTPTLTPTTTVTAVTPQPVGTLGGGSGGTAPNFQDHVHVLSLPGTYFGVEGGSGGVYTSAGKLLIPNVRGANPHRSMQGLGRVVKATTAITVPAGSRGLPVCEDGATDEQVIPCAGGEAGSQFAGIAYESISAGAVGWILAEGIATRVACNLSVARGTALFVGSSGFVSGDQTASFNDIIGSAITNCALTCSGSACLAMTIRRQGGSLLNQQDFPAAVCDGPVGVATSSPSPTSTGPTPTGPAATRTLTPTATPTVTATRTVSPTPTSATPTLTLGVTPTGPAATRTATASPSPVATATFAQVARYASHWSAPSQPAERPAPICIGGDRNNEQWGVLAWPDDSQQRIAYFDIDLPQDYAGFATRMYFEGVTIQPGAAVGTAWYILESACIMNGDNIEPIYDEVNDMTDLTFTITSTVAGTVVDSSTLPNIQTCSAGEHLHMRLRRLNADAILDTYNATFSIRRIVFDQPRS